VVVEPQVFWCPSSSRGKASQGPPRNLVQVGLAQGRGRGGGRGVRCQGGAEPKFGNEPVLDGKDE